MGKKLTFFESLFLNKRDKELLLSSKENIDNTEEFSNENTSGDINENTEKNFKVLLTKTTSLSNLDVDSFVKDDMSDSLTDTEKDLILFDTIENVLDGTLNDNLDDNVVVEEVIELTVQGENDDFNSEDLDGELVLNILDNNDELAEDILDDLSDDANIGDTIVFKASELSNLIENELSKLENDELIDELINLDTDDAEAEFVSLDFGDDSDAMLNDANEDSAFNVVESTVLHFDLDDQLENEYLEDEPFESELNYVSSLDGSNLLDLNSLNDVLDNHANPNEVDISIDIKAEEDEVVITTEVEVFEDVADTTTEVNVDENDVESNFPTLDILPTEQTNELSNDEDLDDEINIPML